MNKPKAQGTAWETELVKLASLYGIPASRIAEGGSRDIGDVRLDLGGPLAEGEYGPRLGTALAWKRLVNSGGSRRTPDGVRDVAVVELELLLSLLALLRVAYQTTALASTPGHGDMGYLLSRLPDAIVIEAKAAERLNVTRVLAKAIEKVRSSGARVFNWKAEAPK